MDTWYWVEWKGNWYPVNNVTDLPATRAGGKRCRVEYIAPEDKQLQYDIVAHGQTWSVGRMVLIISLTSLATETFSRHLQCVQASLVNPVRKRRGLCKIADRPACKEETKEADDSDSSDNDSRGVDSIAS